MANHNISRADMLFAGDVYYARYNTEDRHGAGIRGDLPLFHDFGAPLALDTNALVAAATGAELPNANTITYTAATSGTSPLDDAGLPTVSSVVMADGTTQSVWVLDKARNITSTATHGSAVVAMTMLVSGYDTFGEPMSELHTYTAGGTSKASSTGTKKAFKYIKSYAITSASDATANTLNVGFGDVLGFPFAFTDKNKIIPMGNGALDASATLVIADVAAATTTTGDIRGTIDFATASDGTKTFAAWMILASRSVKETAFGVTQA